jgi:ketopantoate reductase
MNGEADPLFLTEGMRAIGAPQMNIIAIRHLGASLTDLRKWATREVTNEFTFFFHKMNIKVSVSKTIFYFFWRKRIKHFLLNNTMFLLQVIAADVQARPDFALVHTRATSEAWYQGTVNEQRKLEEAKRIQAMEEVSIEYFFLKLSLCVAFALIYDH